MSHCIENTPHTIDITELEEGSDVDYYVKVTSSAPSVTIVISCPAGASIDGVDVTPGGPTCGTNWITFTTSQLDRVYTVQVSYTKPTAGEEALVPIDTPTKSPKFKVQSSCPND